MSYILGGFGWVASDLDNPGGAVFYLDDIQYNLSPAARAARLDRPRFVQSFVTEPYQSLPAPVGIFDLYHRNTADLYDNALALLAFLAEGTADGLRRARLIGDALVYASEHDRTFDDGRLRDIYAAGDLVLPPGWTPHGRSGTVVIPGYYVEEEGAFHEAGQDGLSTGNEAWALIALLALYERTGDSRYLTTAETLGDFIRTFRNDSGTYQGFQGGLTNPEAAMPVLRTWASTEHNLDIFAGFNKLSILTGTGSWAADAEHARQLVEAMWDGSTGCYRAGTLDPQTRNEDPDELPLDVQPWAVLAIPGLLLVHPGVLDCAEQHHRTTHLGISGFDFNTDLDGVWFEGTGQMAVAYEEAGQSAEADAIRATLGNAQGTAPFGDGQGLASASRDGLTTGLDYLYFVRRHIGATAWNVFAQLGFNPFSGAPVNAAGEFFTVAPCRVLDTRNPGQGPVLSSGVARIVQLTGACGVPATARAVAVNITAVNATANGRMTLYPGDLVAPLASTINFAAQTTRANNAFLRLATNGQGTLAILAVLPSGGVVHVVLDVTGYFK